MKKIWIILILAGLLSGCRAAETFETVADELLQPVMGRMGQMLLELPEEASAQVLQNDEDARLYLCEDYTVLVQAMEAGDLSRTVRTLSGYAPEELSILSTRSEAVKRHEWVWTAAGETGDQLCRAVILDDGSYHYCLTVMADAVLAGALDEQWQGIFDSFRIG